ncbi:MAG: FeoB-associated Cys-rich membrane protein [Clostridia bacterium]|nr:FeoB-associated Cys-rich membrane protein [Clostridia bacterium]
MENFIVIAVLVLILGAAIGYVIKAKKSGKKCIGCPDGATCGSKAGGSCNGSCCNCGK